MLRCVNCGHPIASDAPICPSCGKRKAGDEAMEAQVYGPIILVSILFLAPAIILGWIRGVGMIDTVFTLSSWVGSAAFWAVVGVFGYKALNNR